MARIVVADNDLDALSLAVLDLRLEGHEVVGTSQPDQLVELLEQHAATVLVLDHRMPPGPDGLTVAESLRHDRPELRIVLYTNYESAALARRAQADGVVYLPKGDLRRLRSAVSAEGRRPGSGEPRELRRPVP